MHIKEKEIKDCLQGEAGQLSNVLSCLVQLRDELAHVYPRALQWVPGLFLVPDKPWPIERTHTSGAAPSTTHIVVPKEQLGAFVRLHTYAEDEELLLRKLRPTANGDMTVAQYRCVHHASSPTDSDERAMRVADGALAARQGHHCDRCVRIYTSVRCDHALVVSVGAHKPACTSPECRANRSLPHAVKSRMITVRDDGGTESAQRRVWMDGADMLNAYHTAVQRDCEEAKRGRAPRSCARSCGASRRSS
jgi:hypothetical protein